MVIQSLFVDSGDLMTGLLNRLTRNQQHPQTTVQQKPHPPREVNAARLSPPVFSCVRFLLSRQRPMDSPHKSAPVHSGASEAPAAAGTIANSRS